jgi:transcription antitermination factor NusG
MIEQGFEHNVEWYALRIRHQHEKIAATALSNKDFEVFLPMYESVRWWGRRRKTLAAPLFPGYLFLYATLRRWRDVVTTPGVQGFVQLGNRAAVIPEEEIESVRRVLNTSLNAEPCPFLYCGDLVRVKSGPLLGMEGLLIRRKTLYRLVLSVEMIGRSVSVEVDSNIVELVCHERQTNQVPVRALRPSPQRTMNDAWA